MSGAQQALERLEAAAEPVLLEQFAPHAIRLGAAKAVDTGDMLDAAEAMVPLILDLEAAADALGAHAKRLRQVLAEVMDETGAATIRAGMHTASVSRGRAAVAITDEAAIPPHLMRQPPPAPDKAAIAKLLKEGKPVPGASLGNAAPTLSIRSNDR